MLNSQMKVPVDAKINREGLKMPLGPECAGLAVYSSIVSILDHLKWTHRNILEVP